MEGGGEIRQQSVRNTASDFYGELFSCSPIQLHPIKHPRLFNHLSQYHFIQIISGISLGFRQTPSYSPGFVTVSLKMMPLMEVAVCSLRFIL